MKLSFSTSIALMSLSLALVQPINPSLSQSVADSQFLELQSLLKAQKWYEADQETIYLMKNNPENVSCKNLETIDKFWTEASQGKYGLTPQLKIWNQVGGDNCKTCEGEIEKFRKKVGWTLGNRIHPIPGNFEGQFPTVVQFSWEMYIDNATSIGVFSSTAKTWQAWRNLQEGENLFSTFQRCQLQ